MHPTPSLQQDKVIHETERANAAERKSIQLATLLRTAKDNNLSLQLQLTKAQKELELYRIQLDIAQQEIQKAQEIVARIDQARIHAEEQAARDRTKARKLLERAAINDALQKGREAGYKQGLERGKLLAWSEVLVRHSENREDTQRAHQSGTRSSMSSSNSLHHSAISRSRYAETPDNLQPARPHSAHRHPNSSSPVLNFARSSIVRQPRPVLAASRQPQDIDIRSIPSRNSNHSVSHHMYDIPPDGYIPIMDSHSVISLPPPHELKRPVLTNPLGSGSDLSHEQRGGISLHQYQALTEDMRPAVLAKSERSDLYQRPRSPSITSFGSKSTRISQFEFVRPPSRLQNSVVIAPSEFVVENASPTIDVHHSRNLTSSLSTSGKGRKFVGENLAGSPKYSHIPGSTPMYTAPAGPLHHHTFLSSVMQDKSQVPIPLSISEGEAVNHSAIDSSDASIAINVTPASNSPSYTSGETELGLGLLNASQADATLGVHSGHDSPATDAQTSPIVLPDDQLPPGFVPLSSVPIVTPP
ncbi:hypothetical protein AMATHDRAFT_1165 [Amanita thiersii Skay4041]|uniref:Uncharacterized protein n=1 Tax=Amanita thiersii Skay4041 TaxID=703135 RepID=A0A2A9NZJ0_9AGAR|nr:hypothetical protein AMATHDRAFT_1165 [Amanita thiersii Skay4041]